MTYRGPRFDEEATMRFRVFCCRACMDSAGAKGADFDERRESDRKAIEAAYREQGRRCSCGLPLWNAPAEGHTYATKNGGAR